MFVRFVLAKIYSLIFIISGTKSGCQNITHRMSCFGDEDLNSVLLGSIPKHEDLFYLKGTISFADNSSASISNKAYQCQIFKCR